MAAALDISALTLNAKENPDFSKFIVEQIFNNPQLNTLHRVFTGIKMQEQIVFASLLGKTGLKGTSSCTRQSSGAKSTLTQKYWTPAGIEDTLIHCNAELTGLFKAYFDKIQSYKEKYDITGSDEEVFVALLVEESINKTIFRTAWLSDTAIDVADAYSAGLKNAGDVKFYNYIDGIFKQIFAGVTSNSIKRYSIGENTLTTIAAQTSLASGRSVEIFEGVWANSDDRLKADVNALLYVSGGLWENYRQYLQSKGENFTIGYTTDGLAELKWNGKKVVNMNTIWGINLQSDFVDNTTNNAYHLPNMVVLSSPANLPVGTLNETDFTELESWYERKERQNYIAYGFTLDAKVLESYMISVAY